LASFENGFGKGVFLPLFFDSRRVLNLPKEICIKRRRPIFIN
jgi:hypothetical protein